MKTAATNSFIFIMLKKVIVTKRTATSTTYTFWDPIDYDFEMESFDWELRTVSQSPTISSTTSMLSKSDNFVSFFLFMKKKSFSVETEDEVLVYVSDSDETFLRRN